VVPFPFSNLSQYKMRPAVVLADVDRGDWVVCQITSNSYADPHAIFLVADDFATGGLRVGSHARPGKLFTVDESLIVAIEGVLKENALQRVMEAVVSIFNTG
jgi:mRNA interferase MazF